MPNNGLEGSSVENACSLKHVVQDEQAATHMYIAIHHVLLWISYETRGLFLCSVNSNYYNVQIYLKTASEKTWPINTDTETKHTGSNSPVCIYHRHESLIAATTVLSNISRVMHELSRVMHPQIYILSRIFLIFLVSMGHFLFKFIDRFSWSALARRRSFLPQCLSHQSLRPFFFPWIFCSPGCFVTISSAILWNRCRTPQGSLFVDGS